MLGLCRLDQHRHGVGDVRRVDPVPDARAGQNGLALLLQGRDRLGESSAKIIALLFAETDLGRLEALAIRLLHVKTWEKLFSVNGTARHPRGRRNA